MDLLQCLMDSSSHAIFTLDRDGIITHINQQAKVRFGLYHNSQHPHPAGRLEPGDLVLIADTAIGADDGALRPEDLARIGIREPRLRVNDRLVAAGVFDMPGRRPVYKFLPDQDADSLCLETVCEGIPIRLSIERRSVTVTVRDTVYTIGYFRCIGQMVVLDGATGRVKFWQEKGYSARREGIGHLLRGGSYSEKRAGLSLQVEGYHFRDFFEGAQFERDLARVLNGQAPRLEDREYEINGFELVATLLPVPGAEGGRPDGVIVKFRNIEDIHVTILERNNAIKMAERTYRETARKDAPQEASFAERFGFDTLPASVRHRVYKLSQLDCVILITGENGTGKSFLAQAIRQAQPRRGPFVTVDCATISPTLFESEMFGYVGGAFTGANPQGKAGFFEAADGGTIFLDEIGEIPLQIQAKLLSVIQNKVVCRVGSTRSVPVDVRILAATNRDLRAEVAAGRFRQDLYYRLSAFPAQLSRGRVLPHRPADGEDSPEVRRPAQEPVRRGLWQAAGLQLAGQHPGAGKRTGERRGPLRVGAYLCRAHPPGGHSARPAHAEGTAQAGGKADSPADPGPVRRQPCEGHGAAGPVQDRVLRQAEGIPTGLNTSCFWEREFENPNSLSRFFHPGSGYAGSCAPCFADSV